MAVILKLDGVSKSFARVETTDITTALTDVNLEMKSGEFVSLVGTSGCGKSTNRFYNNLNSSCRRKSNS